MMETKSFGRKGASALVTLVLLVVMGIVIIEILPYISEALGIFSTQPNLPVTQGVVVSSVQYPSSVASGTTFDVNFKVANNINGKSATNINLCLDNVGIFTIKSSPGSSTPQQCTLIPSLFAGFSLPETFVIVAPSNNAYENIPYAQLLGYFINYSYSSQASQSVEFVSQDAYNSNDYPAPSGVFGTNAGPISIGFSLSQPTIYGADADAELILSNVGNGIIIGPLQVNVSMDSSLINITQGSFGFNPIIYSNGTIVFVDDDVILGSSATTLSLPIDLNQNELLQLTNNGVPYLSSNVHVSISYEYEQDGFFNIQLDTQNYNIK